MKIWYHSKSGKSLVVVLILLCGCSTPQPMVHRGKLQPVIDARRAQNTSDSAKITPVVPAVTISHQHSDLISSNVLAWGINLTWKTGTNQWSELARFTPTIVCRYFWPPRPLMQSAAVLQASVDGLHWYTATNVAFVIGSLNTQFLAQFNKTKPVEFYKAVWTS